MIKQTRDRGVTSPITLAIALGILFTLIALLVSSGSGIVLNQSNDVEREALQHSAEQTALGFTKVDERGGQIEFSVPASAQGEQYTLAVSTTSEPNVYQIEATTSDVTYTTRVVLSTPARETTVAVEGDVRISEQSGELVIQDV